MLHHTGPGQDHRHTQPLPTPYPIPDLLNISHNQVATTRFCETRNIFSDNKYFLLARNIFSNFSYEENI